MVKKLGVKTMLMMMRMKDKRLKSWPHFELMYDSLLHLFFVDQSVANIDGHQHLRSAGHGQLDVPRVRLSTYGGCAFCYAGPSAWNALPDFKNKQHTFSTYFQTSAETFLLLTVLAHRARSRFFTANALYKLLTYLLTQFCSVKYADAFSCPLTSSSLINNFVAVSFAVKLLRRPEKTEIVHESRDCRSVSTKLTSSLKTFWFASPKQRCSNHHTTAGVSQSTLLMLCTY